MHYKPLSTYNIEPYVFKVFLYGGGHTCDPHL